MRIWLKKGLPSTSPPGLTEHGQGSSSDYAVWYTEGFNPASTRRTPPPCPWGCGGGVHGHPPDGGRPLEDIAPRLDAHLPALQALEATEPVDKFEDIQYGAYQLFLEGDPAVLEEQLHTLFQREEVLVLKHTKKGDKEFDIKPDFQNAQLHPQEDGLLLELRLPCSVNGSTNPALLQEALKRHLGLEPYGAITRKCLLLQDFSPLR
ncbi:MAG: DUF2344 domain-containing protein [Acutalibacter sp.]